MINFRHGGTDKLAMLVLAEFADKNGQCYPSLATIASYMCVTRRQAQSVISRLITKGHITVIGGRAGGFAKIATNKYQINLERLTDAEISTGTGEESSAPTSEVINAPTRAEQRREGGSFTSETRAENNTRTIIEPSLNQSIAPDGAVAKCPHEKIISLYHAILPTCPQVKIWTEKRRQYLQARWRDAKDHQRIDYWERFFKYVAESDFLTGNAQSNQNRNPFVASLEWLVTQGNFVKVIEGKYHSETRSAKPNPWSGNII